MNKETSLVTLAAISLAACAQILVQTQVQAQAQAVTDTGTDTATATATESDSVDVKINTTSVVEQTTDWGYDKKDGRSQIGMSGTRIPGKTMAIKSTTEITKTIKLGAPTQHEVKCESDIDLEYYQKDTVAEVRTLITAENCSSFEAEYQLRVAYFDENGKMQRIEMNEQWPAGHVDQYTTSYDMTPNSRLHRITSRPISCVCEQVQAE